MGCGRGQRRLSLALPSLDSLRPAIWRLPVGREFPSNLSAGASPQESREGAESSVCFESASSPWVDTELGWPALEGSPIPDVLRHPQDAEFLLAEENLRCSSHCGTVKRHACDAPQEVGTK